MKKTVSVMILALLSCTLFLAHDTHLVKASGTIYIRTDGSIDPPTAPIQRNGDIYSLTGKITSDADGIVIERDNIILDGAGHTLQGTDPYDSIGISLLERSNVTIRNMEVWGFAEGIYFNATSHSMISANRIKGNNYEGIALIESTNNSISENDAANNQYGIILYESSSNSIAGNTITNNTNMAGIYFIQSWNNSISRNNITDNGREMWGEEGYGYGIWFEGSSDNSISENRIGANDLDGICFNQSSNGNSIFGNNITNNRFGIYSVESSSNTISENNMANNWYGMGIVLESSNGSISQNSFINDGLYVTGSYGNVVVDNLVNGRPLVYLEGMSHASVIEAGQVILVNCEYIQVENLDLTHTNVGLQLCQTKSTIISGNKITANEGSGVILSDSSNNTIFGNNITANNWDGIDVRGSFDNSISGNHVAANNNYGIVLTESFENSVSRNNIIANKRDGIELDKSSYNSISGNSITASNWYGIHFGYSDNNSVVRNNIENNGYGIRFYESSGNVVFHNNFVDNVNQVWYPYGYLTQWDNGYPFGGNYWSDYNGTDANEDGVGDSPYFIDEENMDRYPIVRALDTDFPVHNLGSGLGYSNIQRAIDAAETEDGHIIAVDEGTYYEHVVLDKTLYLAGERRKAIIDGSRNGTVLHVLTNNTLISGFTIRESGEKFDDEPAIRCGVKVGEYEFPIVNTTIIKNAIQSNYMGIFLWFSFNGTVVDNNIENNTQGVTIENCIWNNIANNTVSKNGVGMNINDAVENTISGNNVISNIAVGLYFDSCQNNIINENHIGNSKYGIALDESSYNTFYCNNFINNTEQVDNADSQNVWDDGYPSGGNYWSDHNPPDADKDKIGDSSYTIDENNIDRYPLIYPFECYDHTYVCSPDLNKDGKVNIVDVTKVATAFGSVPGGSNWGPTADIDLNEVINIVDVTKVAKDYGKTF